MGKLELLALIYFTEAVIIIGLREETVEVTQREQETVEVTQGDGERAYKDTPCQPDKMTTVMTFETHI